MAGWLGSRTSPLSKYASIYERTGYILIQIYIFNYTLKIIIYYN